jgi:hypothetical protein
MRAFLCIVLVCLFAATSVAQIGKNAAVRNGARPTDANPRRAATDKAAKAADQAAADAEMVGALLAAMDADGDHIVTKIEMNKAMAALRKVRKDKQGNMQVPEKAADAGAAVAAGGNPAVAGPGGQLPAGARGNEAMATFMKYDLNRDGRLTPDEVPQQGRVMLQGADLNNDGAIDAGEMKVLSDRMGERMRAWAAGAGAPGAGTGVPGDGGRRPPR